MRYRLRTLLIVLSLGPPVLAAGFFQWEEIAGQTADIAAPTFFACAVLGLPFWIAVKLFEQ